jgi:hypothetical protein
MECGLWLRMTWYKCGEDREHLDHVARKKSRIKIPRATRIGMLPPGYFLARFRPKTKPITRRYLDLVTYFNSRQQALNEACRVKEYLEARLSRPCNVYVHFDEGGPHGHFIFRNADAAGRALRLTIRDCTDIKEGVAQILGRRVSPKGTGRRFVPLKMLKANPAALQEAKREHAAIVQAVDEILKLYRGHDAIRVAAVWGEMRHDTGSVDPKVTSGRQLMARLLNGLAHVGFEVVFRPDGSGETDVLFLDGVPAGRIKHLPPSTLVVQVGADRYQAHVPVLTTDARLSREEITTIEELLRSRYRAEVATFDQERFRKLPGFPTVGAGSPTVQIRKDIVANGPALSMADLARKELPSSRLGSEPFEPGEDSGDDDYPAPGN